MLDASALPGFEILVTQVAAMVARSGNPEGFDAAAWLTDWLDNPLPALGGKKPAQYMENQAGRELLSDLLARMESGAYT